MSNSSVNASIRRKPKSLVVWSLARSAPPPVTHFSIPVELTNTAAFRWYPSNALAIAPDGSHIVFVGGTTNSLQVLLLDGTRRFRELADTEGARNPFFGPHSRRVAFFTERHALKEISLVEGSRPNELLPEVPGGAWAFGDWRADGTIVYSSYNVGLSVFSVDDPGGSHQTLFLPELL